MNEKIKKRIFLLIYLCIPLMVFIPPVYSAPSVTVIHPNGGEILAGTSTIDWTVSNTLIVDEFDANVSYGLTAGTFDSNKTISDVNLLLTCDYDTDSRWLKKNDKITGLDGGVVNQWPIILEQANDDIHIFSKSPASPYNYIIRKWIPGSETWDVNTISTLGLPIDDGGGTRFNLRFWFKIGDTHYLLGHQAGGGSSRTIKGYRYQDGTNDWVADSDITSGLAAIPNSTEKVTFVIEDFQNLTWLIESTQAPRCDAFQATMVVKSYYWDSINLTWVNDDYLANQFDFLKPTDSGNSHGLISSHLLKKDGFLYALISYSDHPAGCVGSSSTNTIIGMRFDDTEARWVVDADINRGLSPDQNFWYAAPTNEIESGVIHLFEISSNTTATGGSANNYEFGEAIDTTETVSCSIPFDTTEIPNGWWFIDINAFDSVNADGSDSSDSRFRILNWTNEDIQCECVSNCSSCVLDVNSFVVTPTSETSDVEIKITNGVGSKNVGYRIKNSDNSGDQYKIFSSNQSDFDAGIWNYESDLTFGTTNYNSIQKIWDSGDDLYKYFFSDVVLSSEILYFKFEYYEPAFHFFSVTEPEWDTQLDPFFSDFNEIETDLFSVSTYSDMSSLLTDPEFSNITSNLSNVNHVFQFTANSDSSVSGELSAGVVANRDFSPTTSLDLLPRYKTISLRDLSSGFFKIESSVSTSRELRFQNYTISERGFFTSPIEILDQFGNELPVMILDANKYSSYVVEGQKFKVRSQYRDPDEQIDYFEITAYIDVVASANKIKKWTIDASGDDFVEIDETLEGLIDLTANAADRIVKITIRLVDVNTNYYEIQSDAITLRQFPNNRKDLDFRITDLVNKKIGDHPEGTIILNTNSPENIIGVQYRIQDSVADNNFADYNKIFYKDIDFICGIFDCSFDYLIEDYIFTSSDTYRVDAWALVKTENTTLVSPFNDLLHDWKSFNISWINFDTARILQVQQRTLQTYRNDEEIPLVVQLRDQTGWNLKNKINIVMQIEECDTAIGTHCREIDLNYGYDSFLFDVETGYNYFFFRQLFVEEDFTRLSDGNYFRFKALISDPTLTYQTIYSPVLADKCQTENAFTFFANMFNMNYYNIGCTALTDEIVALPDSNSHEERILIDEDYVTTSPNYFLWVCIEPDQNNLYQDALAQDILCWSIYLLNEKPIDKFKLYLTNNNSNLDETDDDLKQFIEIDVPFEFVYLNDLTLMKQALQKEYSTDSIGSVGDLILKSADHFLGGLAPIIEFTEDGANATGLLINQGFDLNASLPFWDAGGVDLGNDVNLNFSTPLDPNNITGIMMFRIRNINVVNKKDFENLDDRIERLDPKRFVEFARNEGIRLRNDEVEIDVFVSNMVKVMSEESEAVLVIDEETNNPKINPSNADANAQFNFGVIPAKLTFNLISDMIYSNETLFQRRMVILPYRLIIDSKSGCGLFGINCIIADEPGSLTALILRGDTSFFLAHFFLLAVLTGVILFISVVYRNLKGRNTNTNIHLPGKK